MILKKSQNQNIDRLIHGILLITESRCSLIDEDVSLLKDVIVELNKFKQQRERNGTTNLDLIVKIIGMLTKFFVVNDEISKIIDTLK